MCSSLPSSPSHLALPHSPGEKSSRFFPSSSPVQVFLLLSDGVLPDLWGDYQVHCVCQALGMKSYYDLVPALRGSRSL